MLTGAQHLAFYWYPSTVLPPHYLIRTANTTTIVPIRKIRQGSSVSSRGHPLGPALHSQRVSLQVELVQEEVAAQSGQHGEVEHGEGADVAHGRAPAPLLPAALLQGPQGVPRQERTGTRRRQIGTQILKGKGATGSYILLKNEFLS